VREGPLGDINPETPHDLGWVSDIVFALAAVKTPSAALANTRPAHRALGPDPAPSPCRHRRVRLQSFGEGPVSPRRIAAKPAPRRSHHRPGRSGGPAAGCVHGPGRSGAPAACGRGYPRRRDRAAHVASRRPVCRDVASRGRHVRALRRRRVSQRASRTRGVDANRRVASLWDRSLAVRGAVDASGSKRVRHALAGSVKQGSDRRLLDAERPRRLAVGKADLVDRHQRVAELVGQRGDRARQRDRVDISSGPAAA